MFKKSEPDHGYDTSVNHQAAATPGSAGGALIGPSINVRGDLEGEEDLVIQGRVEGTVKLPKNLVTIGKDGHVRAEVHARVVHVEGKVEGDLNGDEQVVLMRSAQVRGNITAPRVTLEDGCKFKGAIDMDGTAGAAKSAGDGGARVADFKAS